MLRNAGAAADAEDDDDGHDDFEKDVHTQVGNIADLIAKSKEMGDAPRASSNIIRRTQTPIAIERVAVGSHSDIPPVKSTDEAADDAFKEHDEPAVEASDDEAVIELALPLPPPPRSIEMPVVRPLPMLEPPKATWRWGAIAWVVLLIATIGLGTMSYVKISQLEDELASAREQLKK